MIAQLLTTPMEFDIALAYYGKITFLRHKKLIAFFNTAKNIWEAKLDALVSAGLELDMATDFVAWRNKFNFEKMQKELARENITCLILGQKDYPNLLSQIADPPRALFTRGKLPGAERPAVAIVGRRSCTNYAKQVTEAIAEELAGQGVAIISGLALGVDGIAHAAALKAQGITVAVLGSGIDKKTVYPAAHQQLSEQIIKQGGAIISEYPPSFKPTQFSFPERNRIIAGLSLGVLVAEASAKSGALITAKCALDYNRDVFAVPHPITSEAGEGGNNLIKMGAKLTTCAQDILDELHISNVEQIVKNNELLPATPEESKIIPHLSREPIHIDVLIKLSGLDSQKINSTLTMMEMKGKVKNVGGMMYIIK